MDQLVHLTETLVKQQEDIAEDLRTLRKTTDKSQSLTRFLVNSSKLVSF